MTERNRVLAGVASFLLALGLGFLLSAVVAWIAVGVGVGLFAWVGFDHLRARRRNKAREMEARKFHEEVQEYSAALRRNYEADIARREELRARHQLASLTEFESGIAIDDLPDGRFAFVLGSELTRLAPATVERSLQGTLYGHGFEIHRRSDGRLLIVGYTDHRSAAQLEGSGTVEFQLATNPRGEFDTLVAVPLIADAIRRFRQLERCGIADVVSTRPAQDPAGTA